MEALKLGASQGKVDNQQADLDTVVAIIDDGAGEVRWDETGTEDVGAEEEEEDSTSLDVADDAEVGHREVLEGKTTDEEDNPSMVTADGKTEADPGLAAVKEEAGEEEVGEEEEEETSPTVAGDETEVVPGQMHYNNGFVR
ncbi:hypothetical protein Vretifemale_20046 [Volvox reticuliferus]|uniref:Uncharacterized protein n=1 Tax=Volvox reticuliferus TaxID=1737510 RepID=A0A8J4D074_9CHLO|nr:hypothetical protein Vretifemale_20046 [Volvox reticuliferus]